MEKDIKNIDLNTTAEIFGYARISVDIEKEDDKNTSIENQIDFIEDYAKTHFPKAELTVFKDRDRSGYTFEQREQYQLMRKRLMSGEVKILIVKDFSRFSRRNSLGLYELELLRDAGVRIISISDAIDFPTHDEWLQIQFRFLLNEQPVTDTSKKVRAVINKSQSKGEWLCAVPYGYVITNQKKLMFDIVPDEAEIIREIFRLYNDGWGYKKIANYLTDKNIPTPRMKEKERAEAEDKEFNRTVKKEWSIITVSNILSNDFYIGTYRQHKYQRAKINGTDMRVSEEDNIVFEKHHSAIIDDRTFAFTQEQLKLRSKSNYRGIKKYDTAYSGYLICGDCGSPMFSMSRSDLAPAYICGTYHKRGRKGCSSHHVRVDFLDSILKDYIKMVKLNSENMIAQLEDAVADEAKAVKESDNIIEILQTRLNNAKEELKATKKQKIRDMLKSADDKALIEETYAEIERELTERIYGLENQLKTSCDKRSQIIEINRTAKTVFEAFDNILNKEKLDKVDIGLITDKIIVYDNNTITVKLKTDIESILQTGKLPNMELDITDGEDVNFNYDSVDSAYSAKYTQKARNKGAKVYTVNVFNEGDPLEIFTESNGTVIFKKYSPIGELGEFAAQYAESLSKSAGIPACITDKDNVIAVSGVPKKELREKKVSGALEKIMNAKSLFTRTHGDKSIQISDEIDKYEAGVVAPIVYDGDSIGAVVFIAEPSTAVGEVETKLAETAAGFLGKTME